MYQFARVSLLGSLILVLFLGVAPVDASSGSGSGLLQQGTGTIVVVVDTVPEDPRDFFVQFSPTGGGFALDDDPTDGTSSNQLTRTLEAGTYTVKEEAAAGWIVTALTCDDPNSSGNVTTRIATIDLDPGETVTCTFRNEPDLNVPRGTLVIVKDAVPDDPQNFNFSVVGIDFHVPLVDDPGSSSPNKYSVTVAAGTYTALEDEIEGWNLTDLTCADPDNGSNTNLSTRKATLDIDANETVICTFRNEPAPLGTIRLIKDAVPDDPQDFVMQLRDASGAAAGGGLVDDDPGSAIPGNEFSIIREAGTYTAVEGAVSGWTLTGLTCDDPDGQSSGNVSTRTATIDLDANETVTCTFTNTRDGADATPTNTPTFTPTPTAQQTNTPTATVTPSQTPTLTATHTPLATATQTATPAPTLTPTKTPTQPPSGPTCEGQPATIYVSQGKIVGGPNNGQNYQGTLNGTSGADVMVGTTGSDEIDGKGGNDRICSGGGSDDVEGGDGDDRIFGGGGNDDLEGEAGNDRLSGQDGSDELHGDEGSDLLTGGSGGDQFSGGSGTDTATDFNSSQGDTKTSVENT